MRLSAEDAEGEPVVVVVLDPGVEGVEEQPDHHDGGAGRDAGDSGKSNAPPGSSA